MGLLESLFGTKCAECGQKIKGEKFQALGPGWLCQICYRKLEEERKQKDKERKRRTEEKLNRISKEKARGEPHKPSSIFPPSKRPNFIAVESSEVIEPKFLPRDYAWMEKGHYAIYKGELTESAQQPVNANWAWEVNYVKGVTKQGKISCLGYTLFVEDSGESLGNWLSWPVLFTCFFRILPSIDSTYIETPLGITDCFKLSRSIGSGYVTAKLYYEKDTTTLVKMDVHSDLDEQQLYSGILSETNINMHYRDV